MALAEPACDPIPLYRKRSRFPITGMVDHIDTTDVNEANVNYALDRQIATICANQVAGTIPLYRGFNPITRFHFSSVDPNDPLFLGGKKENPRGYVYTEQQNAGFFKIHRLADKKSKTNYFSSEIKDEAVQHGYIYDRDLFWSMPLDACNTTSTQITDSSVVDSSVVDSSSEYSTVDSTVVDSTSGYSTADSTVVDSTTTPCDEATVASAAETIDPSYNSQVVNSEYDSQTVNSGYDSQTVAPVAEPTTPVYDGSNVVADATTPCEEAAPVVDQLAVPYDGSSVAPVADATTIPCPDSTEAPIAIDTPYPTPTDTGSSIPTDTLAPIFSGANSQTVSIAGALLAIVFSL